MINLYESSEEEEDIVPMKRRRFRSLLGNTTFNDSEFKERFRFTRSEVEKLLQLVGPAIITEREGVHVIPPWNRLLIALRFYASNSLLYALGDNEGSINQLDNNQLDYLIRFRSGKVGGMRHSAASDMRLK